MRTNGSSAAARKAHAGMTLIELIVYMGLASLVIVSVLRIMLLVTDTRDQSTTSIDVQQHGRFLVRHILEHATYNSSVLTGSTIFGSQTGTLALSVPNTAESPLLFFLSGTTLYEKRGTKPAASLTDTLVDVNTFRLTNRTATGAPTTVLMQLVLHERTGNPDQPIEVLSLQTSFTTRK